MTSASQVSASEEGKALWFFGTLVLLKASSERTDGRFCLSEQSGRRGVATRLHRHSQDEETFYVLDGELRFYLDGEESYSAPAGTSVYIAPGDAHAFMVISDTARWLNITTPNPEGFFRAAGESARERTLPPDTPPDMGKVMSAAEQYGVEILGPPPGAAPGQSR